MKGYDDKPTKRNDDVTAAVEGDNPFIGPGRATRQNDGPGYRTAETDHYQGGDSTPNQLTGAHARGTFNPPGKIGGYADVSDGSKNPAYSGPSKESNAKILSSFQLGTANNKVK